MDWGRGSVAAPQVHVEGGLEVSSPVGDCVVVDGVESVGAGGVGVGEGEVGLKELDLAVVLGVDAGLPALAVLYGVVFDGGQGAGGAALFLQVGLDVAQDEAGAEGHQQG